MGHEAGFEVVGGIDGDRGLLLVGGKIGRLGRAIGSGLGSDTKTYSRGVRLCPILVAVITTSMTTTRTTHPPIGHTQMLSRKKSKDSSGWQEQERARGRKAVGRLEP